MFWEYTYRELGGWPVQRPQHGKVGRGGKVDTVGIRVIGLHQEPAGEESTEHPDTHEGQVDLDNTLI